MRYMPIALLFAAPFFFGSGSVAARTDQVAPASGQVRDAPSGGTAQEAIGTATISGTVTVAGSGQPARRARVSLSGAGLRGGRTTTTDDMGRFVFAALPAGRYTVRVSKPGHVNVSYGQRRFDGPGTPIQTGEGQRLEIQLQLPRGGVITGTVLDEHGEAIPGTQVRVLRYTAQGGGRTLQQAGSGSTDDRGVYRIYGLQPGDYVVAATPRNTRQFAEVAQRVEEFAAAADRAEALAERTATLQMRLERVAAGLEMVPPTDEGVEGYAPVYYPGTTAPASAATVSVGAGEEKMGIDFSLQVVPIARVEGVVVSSTAEAARNIQVSLVNIGDGLPGLGGGSNRPDADGRFRIQNVAPGRYMLVARGTLGAPGRGGRGRGAFAPAGGRAGRAVQPFADAVRLWAATEVFVDGRNVSDLVLTLQPGITLSGRLVFEGTSPMPSDLSRIRVVATPADAMEARRGTAVSATGNADPNGRFTIDSVVPGRYRISASGAQGWTLASAVVSGQDTLDFPIDVKAEPIGGVILTFKDRQSEITGTIVDEQGQPVPDYTVIVYPSDREFWAPGSRRISSQRPGTDGRFTFRNLPAGEYRIAPVLDPEPGSWYDPAFLDQLDNTAIRVPLGAGEQKVQNLRVAG